MLEDEAGAVPAPDWKSGGWRKPAGVRLLLLPPMLHLTEAQLDGPRNTNPVFCQFESRRWVQHVQHGEDARAVHFYLGVLSAWSDGPPWKWEVASSNLATQTNINKKGGKREHQGNGEGR